MVSSVGCGALFHVLVRVYKNVIVFGFKLNVGYYILSLDSSGFYMVEIFYSGIIGVGIESKYA